MAFITEKRESIQYTGANGVAVAAWLTGATLVSDNGTTLVVSIPDYGNLSFTANDHWLVRSFYAGEHRFSGQYSGAEYTEKLVELA